MQGHTWYKVKLQVRLKQEDRVLELNPENILITCLKFKDTQI